MRDLLGWVLGWFGRGVQIIVRIPPVGEGTIHFPTDELSVIFSGETGSIEVSFDQMTTFFPHSSGVIYFSTDIGTVHGA